jgi:hypothetical protein
METKEEKRILRLLTTALTKGKSVITVGRYDFETQIVLGWNTYDKIETYKTWKEAKKGHKKWVKLLEAGIVEKIINSVEYNFS